MIGAQRGSRNGNLDAMMKPGISLHSTRSKMETNDLPIYLFKAVLARRGY
jgi:hypothetical protein